MAGLIVVAVYVVMGAGAAASVRRKEAHPLRPLLMLALWPFLLPAALFSEPIPRARGRKIESLRDEIRVAFARAPGADAREQRLVEAFAARALAEEQTILELEAALATAPPSVRSRLEELRDRSRGRIDRATGMLEEMLAQLTLLRFAALSSRSGEEERGRIEDLMARIEAAAEVAEMGGSVSPASGGAPRRGALP